MIKYMTKEEFAKAIKDWRSSDQSKEDFVALMHSVARAFRSGIGLGGEEINAAISEAFDDSTTGSDQNSASDLAWALSGLMWRSNTIFSQAELKANIERCLPEIIELIKTEKLSP